jgi:hypothetical protein
MAMVSSMQANFRVTRPSTRNQASASVTSGALTLDLLSGTPLGTIAVTISEASESLPLSLDFQSAAGGGYQVVVTGSGVNFTIR